MRLSPILLLAALLPAGARRVLCLHGLGGSKFAFLEHHLKPLRGAAMASYRDWRPVAWEFDAIDAPLSETGGWWDYSPEGTKSYTADELVGLETSVALVEETIVSGDFCGLFGFSQGAMLAPILPRLLWFPHKAMPSQRFLRASRRSAASTPMLIC